MTLWDIIQGSWMAQNIWKAPSFFLFISFMNAIHFPSTLSVLTCCRTPLSTLWYYKFCCCCCCFYIYNFVLHNNNKLRQFLPPNHFNAFGNWYKSWIFISHVYCFRCIEFSYCSCYIRIKFVCAFFFCYFLFFFVLHMDEMLCMFVSTVVAIVTQFADYKSISACVCVCGWPLSYGPKTMNDGTWGNEFLIQINKCQMF